MSLPLAFNHERHLVAEEVMALRGLEPSGARMPLLFSVSASVDPQRIESALNVIVQRHTALRSAFGPNQNYPHDIRRRQLRLFERSGVFVPGLYVQRVLANVDLRVNQETVASQAELADFVRRELATPLDTATGPPIRATLVSAGPAGVWLLIVFTHQTMDGWSMGVFAREFISVVGNGTGVPAQLPAVPIQYHDFAAWQLQQFRDGCFAEDERYWLAQWSQLGDARIDVTELPFRKSLSRAPLAFSSYQRLPLTPHDSERIAALITNAKLTPYALFRTAMVIALHHYTGKRRLAMWGNFTNRGYPEFVPALGWYANTHIVCVELDRTMTCGAVCHRVSTSVAEAQAHEALPLAALWQRIGRSLDTHNTRVNFDILPARPRSAQPDAIDVAVSPVGPRNIDLDVRLRDDGGTFGLVAIFNAERYATAGVQGLLGSIRRIVTAMAETPELRVSECERFVAAQQRAVPRDGEAGADE